MGQNFNVIVLDEFGNRTTFNRATESDKFNDAFSWLIYHNPLKIVWFGEDVQDLESDQIDEGKGVFDYSGKYLVNHTKKICMSMDEYPKRNYSCYPVALLTSQEGWLDYDGPCKKYVETWAFDVISIEDAVPSGHKLVDTIIFVEDAR